MNEIAVALLLEREYTSPFAERETTAHYSKTVIPIIDTFISDLEHQGGTTWAPLSTAPRHQLQLMPASKTGEYRTSPMRTAALPHTMVERVGEALFPKIGYDHCEIVNESPGLTHFIWVDSANGGYVWATVKDGSHTGFTATSGKRPLLTPEQLAELED